MKTSECFERGLLKRETPDKTKARESLASSAHFLGRAEGVQRTGYPDVALLCAYNSMLQAARAILFADGVKERSHACIVSYLGETHVRGGKMPERLVNVLDMTRLARHKTQYGGRVDVPEAEAQRAIDDARELLACAEWLVGK